MLINMGIYWYQNYKIIMININKHKLNIILVIIYKIIRDNLKNQIQIINNITSILYHKVFGLEMLKTTKQN